MFAKHTAGASITVGAQLLVCVLAAGFVLTHFHHGAHADSDPADYSGAAPASRQLAFATRLDGNTPRVTLRAGPIAVPMTGIGPGPEGTFTASASEWRIVDDDGRTVAHGAVYPDVNRAAVSGGFTVRSAGRSATFQGVSTSLLCVQVEGNSAELAGKHYVLEQSDHGRPDYGRFEIAAPPRRLLERQGR